MGLNSRVGLLRLTVSPNASQPLKSSDLSSPNSDLSGVLSVGTWGNRSSPNMTSITASDTGTNQGIGNGDTIDVVFNKDTNRVTIDRV